MARIRTIKPEFWTDSFMVQLPPLARLIYISLWTAADDHGYLPDEIERLAMEVMPREDIEYFDDWLQFFEAAGKLELYASEDGETCYRIAKWFDHQRVDKPSKSKIIRESSRKVAIPLNVRRSVAEKYGCPPGESVEASCYYCGAPGKIHWHKLYNGRPSGWVTFPGLELEHLECEHSGGKTSKENIVLACRHCNRSKGTKHWIEALFSVNGLPPPVAPASPREDSCEEQGTGKGKEVLTPNKKHPIPADFGISERVANWAKEKGHSNLNAHLENFISAAKKHGYKYVDWDEAFMEAIRKNWAKVEASSMEFINK